MERTAYGPVFTGFHSKLARNYFVTLFSTSIYIYICFIVSSDSQKLYRFLDNEMYELEFTL